MVALRTAIVRAGTCAEIGAYAAIASGSNPTRNLNKNFMTKLYAGTAWFGLVPREATEPEIKRCFTKVLPHHCRRPYCGLRVLLGTFAGRRFRTNPRQSLRPGEMSPIQR